MPSDTIYGLSCRALDEKAVERLHKLKARDKKPFIILISNTSQLNNLGVAAIDAAPALRYWPGPLTIICPAPAAPLWLHRGAKSLAIRQPDDDQLRKLIDKTGPLVSTSVNPAGQKPASSIASAKKYFASMLDFYVDQGIINKKPSTIIRATFSKVEVVRPGAVKIKEAK